MAALDLMSLLTNNGIEQQYQQADPWYQAGRGISQIQMGAPRDNTEAFLMPFLQQSLAGGLAGYGKSQANETAYQDISKMLGGLGYNDVEDAGLRAALEGAEGPVQSMYGQAEAPEGFTIKGAMPDIALALSNKQAQQEAAAKKAEIVGELLAKSSDEALEATRKIEKAKLDATLVNGITPEQQLKLETDVTNKLTTGNEAQKVLETQSKAKNVLEALKKDDPIRAATAIYGFAKLLDPEGVVRKEDGTIVANPGGPAGQLASIANSWLQKGQLTKQTRQSISEIVPNLVQNQYESYEAQKKALVDSVTKQGARADMIGSLPNMQMGDAPPPPPAGYELTGRKDASGNWGIRKKVG